MRLLLIGVGNGAKSCFNRLLDCNDWVKAQLHDLESELTIQKVLNIRVDLYAAL